MAAPLAAFCESHRVVRQVMQSVTPKLTSWKEYALWKSYARSRIPYVRILGDWFDEDGFFKNPHMKPKAISRNYIQKIMNEYRADIAAQKDTP